MDHHLSDHKNPEISQLTSGINGLKKVASTATFNTKLMVANGMILSKLVYLITFWGGARNYLIHRLQQLIKLDQPKL